MVTWQAWKLWQALWQAWKLCGNLRMNRHDPGLSVFRAWLQALQPSPKLRRADLSVYIAAVGYMYNSALVQQFFEVISSVHNSSGQHCVYVVSTAAHLNSAELSFLPRVRLHKPSLTEPTVYTTPPEAH